MSTRSLIWLVHSEWNNLELAQKKQVFKKRRWFEMVDFHKKKVMI